MCSAEKENGGKKAKKFVYNMLKRKGNGFDRRVN